MRNIVIIGASGHGGETLETIEAINADKLQFHVLGFLDDGRDAPTEWHGYPVLGDRSWIVRTPGTRPVIALGIGRPAPRAAVAAWALEQGLELPPLVHPTALVSARVAVPRGALLMSRSRVSLGVTLGDFAHLNHGASVSHDCTVGAFATLSPAVSLAGAVHVGEGAELGIGVVAIPGVRIGAWSIVGAGAVVTRDIAPDAIAVGAPAAAVRIQPHGWQAPGSAAS